jgi:hypothetical protein
MKILWLYIVIALIVFQCSGLCPASENKEPVGSHKAEAYHGDKLLEDWNSIEAFEDYGIVLVGCKVCKNDESPGINDFSRRTQGWSGCTDGMNEPHFIFKTNVPQDVCDEYLRKAGCVSKNRFPVEVAVQKMKSGKVDKNHYLDGTPVLVSVRWKEGDTIHELPFEQFFTEMVETDNGEYQKPFTPHFVYHGSGPLNPKNYGCLVCQQDCSGGLICNNQVPCVKPVPLLKPDWNLIPKPGTIVTLTIRTLPQR